MTLPKLPETKWAVRLYSRHTGNTLLLGSRYCTREEAEKYATDEYVCHRCNRVDVVPTTEDYRSVREQQAYGF